MSFLNKLKHCKKKILLPLTWELNLGPQDEKPTLPLDHGELYYKVNCISHKPVLEETSDPQRKTSLDDHKLLKQIIASQYSITDERATFPPNLHNAPHDRDVSECQRLVRRFANFHHGHGALPGLARVFRRLTPHVLAV